MVLAAYAKPWPGAVRVVDAATGAALADLMRPAVMGEVLDGFGPGPTTVWDRGSQLMIRLFGGHVADGAEASLLAGSNRLAVETDDGGWEIVGFAEAELIAEGEYRLSRLLRGLGGSERAMGAVSGGRRVLVLDGRCVTLSVEAGRLGESRTLRAYAGANDLVGETLTATADIAAALPLAPVHLRARKLASGDIALSWLRRSRADDDGWGIAEPALDVTPERYRLQVFDGTTLMRTIETSSAGATYTLAEQVTDFGGAAGAFGFMVAQVSPVLGPGQIGEGTYSG
jgi:hypothetical protein